MKIMYHFSSFIILFYNIVQENGKSPAGPEEGSPKMERNPGAGPANPGAILEMETSPQITQVREEIHAAGPRTSKDTMLPPIAMQSEDQNGKFIIEEVPTSSGKKQLYYIYEKGIPNSKF